MHILFATAELAPFVRVGGLAEAAGGLVVALRHAGVTVDVVVPDYFGDATELTDETTVSLAVPSWVGEATARTGTLAEFGEITLVRVPGIERAHPYGDPGTFGYADNDQRFFGFSAAIAALSALRSVDVLHVNDWHTSPTLGMVGPDVPTVLSIHNLAYQGQCHIGWLDVLGEFGTDRRRAYERAGECNPLAGALRLADRIVAVSPNYAKEILTPEASAGLGDILNARADAVLGILNGIDTASWDPAIDEYLSANYKSGDLRTGSAVAKSACRIALRAEVGLPEADGPLIGFVTRLVDQKGVDFLLDAVPFLDGLGAQLVVLGAGDPMLAERLRSISATQPHTVQFREAFDLGFAHRIFAGADLYAMPSRFEPCGLAQMQAMAYGTIPVVTPVGGLVDTVVDADLDPENGNGFVARTVNAAGLTDALHRAVAAWRVKRRRAQIIRNGMSVDWSWHGPAGEYAAMYRELAPLR